MTRGRKPKPQHLKIVTGKTHVPDEAVRVDLECPDPPKWLSASAREIWDEMLPELVKLGVTARVDMHTIATYCNIVSRMVRAQKVLDEEGETYETKGKSGPMLRYRPELKIVMECESKLARYAVEFGMTPSSRTRLRTDMRQGDLFDPTA